MQKFLFITLWTVGIILLTSIVGFVLWSLIAVSIVFLKAKSFWRVYGAAFGFGIVSDLVLGFPLGFSSLFLLVFSLCLFALSVRFRADLRIVILTALAFEVMYFLSYYLLPI